MGQGRGRGRSLEHLKAEGNLEFKGLIRRDSRAPVLSNPPVNSIVSEPRTERECPDEPQAGLGSSEFAELYTEHSRAIYYLCLRLLSDPDKAEDATHDVFLKAFRKMNQFRGESSWRTWLYRIAINHCHNLQAAWHDRHMLTNADEALWETTPAQTDSPLRVLETKELGRAHSEDARWAAGGTSAPAAAGRR